MKRSFVLGSEWLYVKLYLGEPSADYFLIHHIYPFVTKVLRQKMIDKFFFIRYKDEGGFHIRLRLHLTTIQCIGQVVVLLESRFAKLLDVHIIKRIVYDTYTRELARYGYSSYPMTEEIFYYDSLIQLRLIKILRNNMNVDLRWQTGLLLMWDLLEVYNLKPEDLKVLMERNRDLYRIEFGCNDDSMSHNHDKKYREKKVLIEQAIERNIPKDINSLLIHRRNQLKKVYSRITVPRTINKDDYFTSLIHMSINRFFEDSNRVYEMVLYEFLYKYIESYIARCKYSND